MASNISSVKVVNGKELQDFLEEIEIYVCKTFKSSSSEMKNTAINVVAMFSPHNPLFMVFMLPSYKKYI